MTKKNLVAMTPDVEKGDGSVKKGQILIKETLQNIYEHFVETSASSLYAETMADMKEVLEMRRYEASKYLVDIFGLGWKTAGNVLSFMAKGDFASAEGAVRRRLLA